MEEHLDDSILFFGRIFLSLRIHGDRMQLSAFTTLGI